jgi:phosphoribosylamine-glycine ligase
VDGIISDILSDPKYPLFGFNKKVLLLGSGGREHAIALKLSHSYAVSHIFVAPGNGGTATCSSKVSNIDLNIGDINAIEYFVKSNGIDLVVVGPEQPLVDGVSDAMSILVGDISSYN